MIGFKENRKKEISCGDGEKANNIRYGGKRKKDTRNVQRSGGNERKRKVISKNRTSERREYAKNKRKEKIK